MPFFAVSGYIVIERNGKSKGAVCSAFTSISQPACWLFYFMTNGHEVSGTSRPFCRPPILTVLLRAAI